MDRGIALRIGQAVTRYSGDFTDPDHNSAVVRQPGTPRSMHRGAGAHVSISLDYLIGTNEDCRRYRDPKFTSGLGIDAEVKAIRRDQRQVRRLRPM